MGKSPTLSVMINAARKASVNLLRDFGEVENLQVSQKGPGDFVSQADKKAEQIIIDELSAARPDYAILAEEGGNKETDSKFRFVIDPLDGTNNFLHGLPYWAVSIGLEEDGVPVAGVVYVPVLDELFFAEKGQGAYMNDRRIRVSGRRDTHTAMIAAASPSSVRRKHKAPFPVNHIHKELGANMASVRCYNAAAVDLAYTAAGKFDGAVDLALKKWDVCAGIVLVKEAGGKVSGVLGKDDGYESGDLLASNYHLHDKLLSILSPQK